VRVSLCMCVRVCSCVRVLCVCALLVVGVMIRTLFLPDGPGPGPKKPAPKPQPGKRPKAPTMSDKPPSDASLYRVCWCPSHLS
jgi:hypothetical protein